MSFTIQPDDAVRPYVIVPDNTEKPAATKEANISFYVFIDGHYKLIKNINAEQHYIIKANSGRASRYYLRATPDDTISKIYSEFWFHSEQAGARRRSEREDSVWLCDRQPCVLYSTL